MRSKNRSTISRRSFAASLGATFSLAPAVTNGQSIVPIKRNISTFQTHDWRDHFDTLGVGVIVSDTVSKFLQHWTQDGQMWIYQTSVPMSEDLTKRGLTEVVEKRKNPGWSPTQSMLDRDPNLPRRVKGGDPVNPLGTRALYLSWQYYRIHGTNDTRKIGRKSSNGCIGLFNEDIEMMYERVIVGTKVKLI